MLYKEEKSQEDKDGDVIWRWTEWRYWCSCTSPDHCLIFTEDEDKKVDLNISVCSRTQSLLGANVRDAPDIFWRRIKNAWNLLTGKEICYIDVCICEDDRKELAAAIKGDEIVT